MIDSDREDEKNYCLPKNKVSILPTKVLFVFASSKEEAICKDSSTVFYLLIYEKKTFGTESAAALWKKNKCSEERNNFFFQFHKTLNSLMLNLKWKKISLRSRFEFMFTILN